VASADPLAQSLPWECLYHPQHGFLGQQPGFTLSRRLTADESPPAELSTGPLKALLFNSMPDDLDPEKERLDVESVQADVLEALDPLIQGGLVELTTPDDGRFAHLQALLREENFHLVFLSGHGEFREIPFQPPAAVFIFEVRTATPRRWRALPWRRHSRAARCRRWCYPPVNPANPPPPI